MFYCCLFEEMNVFMGDIVVGREFQLNITFRV